MRRRLFLTYLFLIVIIITITGIISLKFTERSYLSMVEDRLVDNAAVLRDYILSYADPADYDAIAKGYGGEFGMRLTIISPDGTVIGDSFADIEEMDRHHDRPEVEEAGRGWIGQSTRYSDTLKARMMYVAIPLHNQAGVLRVAMPLDEIKVNIQALWRNILLTLVIAFSIAAYQGNRFSLNVTKPVLEMVGLSQRIARGEFDKRMDTRTWDEMGQLEEAFNTMASRLEHSMGELKDNNLKLEAILSSMVDGIIAVDVNLDIILINPMAKTIFHLSDDCMGKYFLEVFRFNQLDKMLQKVLYKDAVSSLEMNLDNNEERSIRIHAAPIKEEGKTMGAVVLVQDITELRRLEQVRTDFAANVSHELKTPLTSIKGFVETLQAGAVKDSDTAAKFLDIINIETDRLTRLINDILSISELETKKNSILVEKVNIADVVRETTEMMKTYARSKNIAISHLFAQQDIYLLGSRDRIKQMVINLIDNAIKYTPNDGSVTILIDDARDKIVLRVRDTGIGIAREHIPRLFERFYRVDKGRSRSLGGTGLGLAIVKHIVLSMKGEIEVESKLGKGTEFIIRIPKV